MIRINIFNSKSVVIESNSEVDEVLTKELTYDDPKLAFQKTKNINRLKQLNAVLNNSPFKPP